MTIEPIVLFPVLCFTAYMALSIWRPAQASPSDLSDCPKPSRNCWILAASFLAGAAFPAAFHLAITWHTTGGLLPVQLRPELWHYPGSYWNHPVSWDALAEPKWQYSLLCFFGGRGYFTLTPVLLLGLAGILQGLRRGGNDSGLSGGRLSDGRLSDGRLPRAEALLFLSGFALLAVYVIAKTSNYGGGHYGMRWFLVTVPWLVLGLVPVWLSLRSRWARAGVALLVLPGLYTAQLFWFGKPTVYELLLMRWGLLVLPP